MIIFRTPRDGLARRKWMESPSKHIPRASGPLATVRENPEHLKILEAWMKSYKAEELFDENGKFIDELAALSLQETAVWVATPRQWRTRADHPRAARLHRLRARNPWARTGSG